jgi:hypothetical protein
MTCPTLPRRPRRQSRSARLIFLDQRRRIERQRGLIARLESDGSPDSVAEAVRILGEMEQALAQMEAHHAAAQEQPLEDSVDEPTLAKVEPLR